MVVVDGQRVVMISSYGRGVSFGDAAYQWLTDSAAGYFLTIRLVEAREADEY